MTESPRPRRLKIEVTDSTFDNALSHKFDLILFASGYERRSRFLLGKMRAYLESSDAEKLCLGFSDFSDLFDRPTNDRAFDRAGIEFIYVDKKPYGTLAQNIVHRIMKTHKRGSRVSMLVDYTVMRRLWYAEIVQIGKYLAEQDYELDIFFSYSPGSYMGKKKLRIVDDSILIPGFEGVNRQKHEKYGIYSLGYEPIAVQSIHDWLEPVAVTCIVADPGAKPGSAKYCLNLNKDFIENNKTKLIRLPIHSVNLYTYYVGDIVKEYVDNFDVILFGSGPKPFILGDLLVSLIWEKPTNVYMKGSESEPINVEATGEFVVTRVQISI